MDSQMGAIKKRITELGSDRAFSAFDFRDIANDETIKKSLIRLEKTGEIRRILRGVYDKPVFSKLLNENAAPNPHGVACAIARKSSWDIVPSGDTALNLLSLSTQVVANWTYVSSGPNKKYKYDNTNIAFKHRANRMVSGFSMTTATVIQALQALGEDNISHKVIKQIRKQLTQDEREQALSEGKKTTLWIYRAIQVICKGV